MTFIEKLRAGRLLKGTMLTLPSPEVAEMVSRCGFDWLFLDGEHAPLSILDWQRMIQATSGRCANILRLPENTEAAVKQALDIGADGIIAPKVNSADEARQIVSWCKYPPTGERGVGLARAQGYGLDFADYLARANDDLAVIVQAEHIDAINNIEAIAEVQGIDAVFIGPYDLSTSMNRMGDINHDDVVAAIDRVTRACQAHDLALGYFGVTTESVLPYVDKGYRLICAGVDASFITSGASAVIEALDELP